MTEDPVSDVSAVAGLAGFLLDRYREEAPMWQHICHGPRRYGKTHARSHLADLDAKRRIVAGHAANTHGDCRRCHWSMGHMEHPCQTLRLLALPYVSHPEWRAEWRA